jgi:hypothetical protein
LFSFGWWDVSNRLKQSMAIEPINPLEGGELNGLEVAPGPAPINELGFVEADDRFSQCVELLSTPGVEMAGFETRKYRDTVSRLIPNSCAMRRCDHPRSLRLYIVVCVLTLRTFDIPKNRR